MIEYTKRNASIVVRRQRLKDLLEKKGLSYNEAARRAGMGLGSVRDIMSGKVTSPRYDTLRAIGNLLGCSPEYLTGEIDTYYPEESGNTVRAPVVGSASAGAWIEVDSVMDEPSEFIDIPRHPKYVNSDYIVWSVSGDSMNLVAPDGSKAVCIPFASTGSDISDDMLVIAERCIGDGALCETTIKRVKVTSGGVALMPESTNKAHKPIIMNQFRSNETVTIKAVVIAIYQDVS